MYPESSGLAARLTRSFASVRFRSHSASSSARRSSQIIAGDKGLHSLSTGSSVQPMPSTPTLAPLLGLTCPLLLTSFFLFLTGSHQYWDFFLPIMGEGGG